MMRTRKNNRVRRSLAVVIAAALSALCLQVGGALTQEPIAPRLSHSIGQPAASDGITDLHRSLESLAHAFEHPLAHNHHGRAIELHSALSRLAEKSATLSNDRSPRLSRNLPATHSVPAGNALSVLASSLLSAQQRLPRAQAISAISSIDDLRRAMRRFDVVTDTVVSETFSTVLLGLSDTMPTLSDNLVHPRVTKDDLRERIVDARLAASVAGPSLPLAGYTGPKLGFAEQVPGEKARDDTALADVSTAIDNAEFATLEGAVGEVALGGMAALPNGPSTGALEADMQYASDEQGLLDDIDIDALGGAEIAGLDRAVATDDLQETRAGFMLPNGVRIDFAVTRLTSVDGLNELHSIASLPAGLDSDTLSQISVGRFANTQVLSPNDRSMITFVQNDLNNQRIVDITTIDIGIKNLGVRAADFIPRSIVPFATTPPELRR